MSNYLASTATGPGAADAFFVALSAHLVTNGWTVYDTITATAGSRDVVWRGAALDATADNRPFIRITESSLTNWNIFCYADYDLSTHTGIAVAGGSGGSNFTLQDTSFAFFLWANGVALALCAKIGGTYTRSCVGFCRRGLSTSRGGVTKTTAGVSIGATSLSVASDMTGKLVVGQRIQIMNYSHSSASANATKAETVTVTSIASSAIGVSALTKAYDSGALVGQNPHPIFVSVQESGATNIPSQGIYMPYDTTGSRASAFGQVAAVTNNIIGNEGSLDPTDDSAEYGVGIMVITQNTGGVNGLRGYLYGWWGCAGGSQSNEDIMDDGTNTYIVLSLNASGACIMGPR